MLLEKIINKYTLGIMGKMYFPDEVPDKKTALAKQDEAYNSEWTKVFLRTIGVRLIIVIILMICYVLFFE